MPEMSETAFQNAEYVSAVSSVTVSPDRDCEPRRFQSDGFHALSSVKERLKNRLIRLNSRKAIPPRFGYIGGIVFECYRDVKIIR